MTLAPTPRFGAWIAVALLASIAAALGHPLGLTIALPILLALAAAVLFPPRISRVALTAAVHESFEGDAISLTLTLAPPPPAGHAYLVLTDSLRSAPPRRIALPSSGMLTFDERPARFGLWHFDRSRVVVDGLFGLLRARHPVTLTTPIKVLPRIDHLEALERLARTRFGIGRHRSRTPSAAGLEFIDVREAGPNDRLVDVNWKLVARTGRYWLNQRASDLPIDVVLCLDTFPSPLTSEVIRLGANLARAHLHALDRVSLVIFGGTIGWLPPGSGWLQERAIADRLLRTREYPSVADKQITLIPRSVIPRDATVLAVSPLVDERFVRAVIDLRALGHPVVVWDPTPHPPAGRLARLVRLQLEADLANLGVELLQVPVSPWNCSANE